MKRPYGGTLEEKIERGTVRIPFSGCHIWTLSSAGKGYGVIQHEGVQQYLHRLVWSIKNGPIPYGMNVCHTCDVPACANPDHLFLGTPKENSIDRDRKGRRKGGFPDGYVHPFKLNPSLAQGENSRFSRLRTADVFEIVRLHGEGVPVREIAGKFGIARITAFNIATKRTWKHLWSQA